MRHTSALSSCCCQCGDMFAAARDAELDVDEDRWPVVAALCIGPGEGTWDK